MNLIITRHAVERFRERVNPTLSRGDAFWALRRRLDGRGFSERPEWMHYNGDQTRYVKIDTNAYAVVSPENKITTVVALDKVLDTC